MFFTKYFNDISQNLHSVDLSLLQDSANLILSASQNKNKIIFVGNGGSASIASHLVVDSINAAGIRATNFSDPGIITCFANDYGYENWVSKALDCYADQGDVVCLISSSGQSNNMLTAAKKAKLMGLNVITLTGFSNDNPLRKLGDINFWLNSDKYNTVEMVHHIWLLSIVDCLIELKKEF